MSLLIDSQMLLILNFTFEEELVGTFGSFFGTSFLSLEDLDEPTKFDSAPEWFGIGSRYLCLPCIQRIQLISHRSAHERSSEKEKYGVVSTLSQPIDSGATRTIKLGKPLLDLNRWINLNNLESLGLRL